MVYSSNLYENNKGLFKINNLNDNIKIINKILISYNYAYPDNILRYYIKKLNKSHSSKNITNSICYSHQCPSECRQHNYSYSPIDTAKYPRTNEPLSKIPINTPDSANTESINIRFLNNTHLKNHRLATIQHWNKLHYFDTGYRYE